MNSIDKIRESLKSQVLDIKKEGRSMERSDWGDEEGILINGSQAESLLIVLEATMIVGEFLKD